MPIWPETLPTAPLYQGWAETEPTNYVEFQPSVGAPMRRRRSTAVVRPFQVSFSVTTAQAASLLAFYNSDCAGGSLSFTGLTNPRTGAALTFMFQGEVQITDANPSAADVTYKASFGLLELP
jgi:hypothetical protein